MSNPVYIWVKEANQNRAWFLGDSQRGVGLSFLGSLKNRKQNGGTLEANTHNCSLPEFLDFKLLGLDYFSGKQKVPGPFWTNPLRK